MLFALAISMPFEAAAQVPPPKPKPKQQAPPKPTTIVRQGIALISSDTAVAVTIDGVAVATLEADEFRRLTLSVGKHIVVASTPRGERWDGVVDIRADGQEPVLIKLRDKTGPIVPLAPIKLPAAAKLVEVTAGTFQMGCVPRDVLCQSDELPRHAVRLTRSFWMLATEVTIAQFREYVADTRRQLPSQPKWASPAHPIVNITWPEAAAFCTWLGGRLPTEAEWERAARLGASETPWTTGAVFASGAANSQSTSGRDAWMNSSPVGAFPATSGFQDLAGNVWEWNADWYSKQLSEVEAADPKGPLSGLLRVVRGGSWNTPPPSLRTSERDGLTPDLRYEDVGFRCVTDRAP